MKVSHILASLIFVFILGTLAGRFVGRTAMQSISLGDSNGIWIQFSERKSRLEISAVSGGVRKIGIVEESGSVPVSLDYGDVISNVIWSKSNGEETSVVFDKDGNGFPESLMKLGNGDEIYAIEIIKKKVSKEPGDE